MRGGNLVDDQYWSSMFSGIIVNRTRDALDAGVTPQAAIVVLVSNAASLHVAVAPEHEDAAFERIAALAVNTARQAKHEKDGPLLVLPGSGKAN